MQQSIRLSLAALSTAALSIAYLPLAPVEAKPAEVVQEAGDLGGVMEVSLKDHVKFNWGFQGETQGAGTPNSIGIGGFLPLYVGKNSVFFADVQADADLPDVDGSSSIVNTDVGGTTISTSTRLGYRWLNGDRSLMFGVNAGYDSRPLKSAGDDTGIPITDERTAFFQQIAAGMEVVSNHWNLNAFALVPVGDVEQKLNSYYYGGALDTYGLDAGYNITPDLKATLSYYYQQGDLGEADGSGIKGRLAYNISDGLTIGTNLSYDEAFATRFSADIKYRFGSNGYASPKKQNPPIQPVIQALSSKVTHRDVRVHDAEIFDVSKYPSCYLFLKYRTYAADKACAESLGGDKDKVNAWAQVRTYFLKTYPAAFWPDENSVAQCEINNVGGWDPLVYNFLCVQPNRNQTVNLDPGCAISGVIDRRICWRVRN